MKNKLFLLYYNNLPIFATIQTLNNSSGHYRYSRYLCCAKKSFHYRKPGKNKPCFRQAEASNDQAKSRLYPTYWFTDSMHSLSLGSCCIRCRREKSPADQNCRKNGQFEIPKELSGLPLRTLDTLGPGGRSYGRAFQTDDHSHSDIHKWALQTSLKSYCALTVMLSSYNSTK